MPLDAGPRRRAVVALRRVLDGAPEGGAFSLAPLAETGKARSHATVLKPSLAVWLGPVASPINIYTEYY